MNIDLTNDIYNGCTAQVRGPFENHINIFQDKLIGADNYEEKPQYIKKISICVENCYKIYLDGTEFLFPEDGILELNNVKITSLKFQSINDTKLVTGTVEYLAAYMTDSDIKDEDSDNTVDNKIPSSNDFIYNKNIESLFKH